MRRVWALAAALAATGCGAEQTAAGATTAATAPEATPAAVAAQATAPAPAPAVRHTGPFAADGSAPGFVRALYFRYGMPSDQVDGETAEFQDENVYTPAVLALMARDRDLHEGELGFIDADWICLCQDSEGVRLTNLELAPQGADRATADVRFSWGDAASERRVRLMLERTPVGWRVADVIPEGDPGLVAGLTRSNAEAARARDAR